MLHPNVIVKWACCGGAKGTTSRQRAYSTWAASLKSMVKMEREEGREGEKWPCLECQSPGEIWGLPGKKETKTKQQHKTQYPLAFKLHAFDIEKKGGDKMNLRPHHFISTNVFFKQNCTLVSSNIKSDCNRLRRKKNVQNGRKLLTSYCHLTWTIL